MRCLRCDHENPENNKFCGECGRVLPRQDASRAGANDLAKNDLSKEVSRVPPSPVLGGEARQVSSNPLVREPRSVHDPVVLENASPQREPAREFAAPTFGGMATPPRTTSDSVYGSNHDPSLDRISGPSFLGLSDAPASGSEYLLEEDQPERSYWRGVIFLLVLVLLGLGAWRHWDFVKSQAALVTQRATAPNQAPQLKPSANKTEEANPENGPTAQAAAAGQSSDSAFPRTSSAEEEKRKQIAASSNPSADATKAASETETSKQPDELAQNLAPSAVSAKDAKPQSDQPSTGGEQQDTAAKPAARAAPPRMDNTKVEMAEKYIHGRGVPQNCSAGLDLLRQASANSNPRAFIQMGALYQSGTCVSEDRAQAYRWFAKALSIEPNNRFLEYNMTSLWASMSDDERQRALH